LYEPFVAEDGHQDQVDMSTIAELGVALDALYHEAALLIGALTKRSPLGTGAPNGAGTRQPTSAT